MAALVLVVALSAGAWAQQAVIHQINIHGNRRIPAETIRARMFVHSGDIFDAAALERDFMSLWNTGYFDDIRFERADTAKGVDLEVYVHEKPTIRKIEYVGLNSASQSDVLDRFKERKVQLTTESQYDPTRVKKAEVVLKELLSERGRQFATIRTEIHQIPPAAVSVTFIVREGPKVKVGTIRFQGNKKLSTRYLRSAMKNLKPIGVPKSLIFENLFSRTFDATKLNEDTERVRFAAQQRGYFKVLVQDPKTKVRDVHHAVPIPLIHKNGGKVVDITIPIEEGERYRLKDIKFTGNKAVTNTKALRGLFAMKDGEVFDVDKVRKGLEELRKAYGALGYINFSPVPDFKIDDEKRMISLVVDMDEGKPFYVRRIEFQGNTTTRDKVIRRELALEEGNIYNSRLWELSVMRLNQLQYFESLKPEQDSEIHQNQAEGTVDITLKVKEKGKNQIGLTGGVSGLSGSFIGLSYTTNNFLGLGETLTVEAQVGSVSRNVMFGFTEPYMFDRPLQTGFTVYGRKYDYNQLKQNEILTGVSAGNVPEAILQNLQNYTQSSTGFTASASYPLRHFLRGLSRVGITYGYDVSSIQTFSTASQQIFQSLAFRNFGGPNALNGIVTSKITPSFFYNGIDNPQRPHKGKSFLAAMDIAGLGGSVRDIRPVVEFKQFIPMHFLKPTPKDPARGRQTFGYRLQASFITGFGGIVAPPLERFFTGGDTDLRGFDVRSLTPYAYISQLVQYPLVSPSDLCLTIATTCTPIPKDANNPLRGAYTVPLQVQSLVWTGGDTNVIGNFEYRIPIAGPVAIAAFADVGLNMALRKNQLRLNEQTLADLVGTSFGCPTLDPTTFTCTGGVATPVNAILKPISGTNFLPRMSTGLELQVLMPIINAPVRIYYAFNPLRLDTFTTPPGTITRGMFPAGDIGDFNYQRALSLYNAGAFLKEPKKTFRFTVATTF